jgi:hypothetical protein
MGLRGVFFHSRRVFDLDMWRMVFDIAFQRVLTGKW